MRPGIVVGMTGEAACLLGVVARAHIVCSGARPDLARTRAQGLLDQGATALISFGLAGGLAEALEPGTLLLPEGVVLPGQSETLAADPDWRLRLSALAEAAGVALITSGTIVGSDHAITTVAAKAELRHTTRALAVDMESHVVAQAARRHNLPFLVLRAVGDPARHALPAPALCGLSAEGTPQPWAVLRALARAPWTLPALLRVAADSRRGLAALRRAALGLGPTAFFGRNGRP